MRILALVVLVGVAALSVVLLLGASSDQQYRLLFQTGGQLVPGNEVLIGGRPVGLVDSIELTDDNQAAVEISTSEPIPEGTTAIVRTTSMSGVANRYISLAPGPGPSMLEDGATITAAETTSPVDLDQLFNLFRKRERDALSQFIRGNAAIYAGRGKQANRTYKFFNPALSSTERLFAELNADQAVLEQFLVQGAEATAAIADRRDDLAGLVGNANEALGAISAENEALERTLVAFPPAMRQANTTFVNLRSVLADLDPLVTAAKPATRDLTPFLRETRPVVAKSVPVFDDLADVLAPAGTQKILRTLPEVKRLSGKTVPRSITALDDFEPVLQFARPYTPDVLGWLTKFGQATAYYDANGHYARAMPAGVNVFDYDAATEQLNPIYQQPEKQFDFYKSTPGALGTFLRCPGGATQPNLGWAATPDHTWLDDGRLGAGDCNPDDVPPGLPALP